MARYTPPSGDGQPHTGEPILRFGPSAPNTRRPFGRWGTVGLFVGFWVLVTTVSVSGEVMAAAHKPCGGGGLMAGLNQVPAYLRENFLLFGGWALLTPLVFWASRRMTELHRSWRRTLPLAALGTFAVLVAMAFIKLYQHNFAEHGAWGYHGPSSATSLFVGGFTFDLLILSAMTVASLALSYYRVLKERQTEAATLRADAAQLEMQLMQARYQALRMQMHPHFLFNTLNTVSALVESDPIATRRVVAHLSAMLRRALATSEDQEIPLAEELDFTQKYLGIEQIRFGDRLRVQYNVDPAARTIRVPTLILQPLVENAVHHGIARSARPGEIELEAVLENDLLVLRVRDNGPGCPDADLEEGVGLGNTRARLYQRYGDACSLTVRRAPQGGCLAEIKLPLPVLPEPIPSLSTPDVSHAL